MCYGSAPQPPQQMARGFSLGVGGCVDVPCHISTDTSRILGDGEVTLSSLKGSTWLADWRSFEKKKLIISNVGMLK